MKSFREEIKVYLLLELDDKNLREELTNFAPIFFKKYSCQTFEQFMAEAWTIFAKNEYNQVDEFYFDTSEYKYMSRERDRLEEQIAKEVYDNYIKENK